MSYHPSLIHKALPLKGMTFQMMHALALRYKGYVGGSFIAIRGREIYNTFVLVHPNGNFTTHDKDIPTMWEGCYYRGGSHDGIMLTKDGLIGSVLCWEYIRWATVRRLVRKVQIVVGGSCWPSLSFSLKSRLLTKIIASDEEKNKQITHEAASARSARGACWSCRCI